MSNIPVNTKSNPNELYTNPSTRFVDTSGSSPVKYVDTSSSMFIEGFNIEDYYGKVRDVSPYSLGITALQDERAQNQSRLDKWGNAAGKMAITAATTFLDGTIGTVAGLVNMAIEGEGSAFWNNGVSKFFQSIQDIAEEDWLPNYYTQRELERPWYENMVTANFWADKVLKNMGFMIGTVASSMLYGGGVRNLAGAKNIANSIGKGLIGKTTKSGRLITNADDAFAAYIRGEVSGSQIVGELAKDAKKLRNIDGVSQWVGSIAGSVGEARIEALQGVKEYAEKRRMEEPDIDEKILQKELTDIGNSIFATNMAVLSLGNYAQFKNAIGGGYKVNKINYNNLVKGNYKTKFESALPKTKLGKIGRGTLTTGKALSNPMWEGMEEQLQKVGQEASTTFYGKGKDDKTEELSQSYIEQFGKDLGKQFESIDNWEEFAIGFISGGLGAPTIKNKRPILAGGVYGDIKAQIQKDKQVERVVEAANKSRERLNTVYDSHLVNIDAESRKKEAVELGNRFEWENANSDQIINDINTAIELGRFEEFKEELRAKKNISSEEIKAFFEKQTDLKNENRYENRNEEEIKKEVNERIDNVLEVADKVREIRDDLKLKFSKASDKVLNEISWQIATEDNLAKRSDSVVKKINSLTELLDGRTAQELAIRGAQLEGTTNYLATFKGRLLNIKSQISRLNKKILTNSEYSDLQKEISELKEALKTTKMFSSLENLEGHLGVLKTSMDELSNEIDNLEYTATTLKQKSDFSPIETDKNKILPANRKASRRLFEKARKLTEVSKKLKGQKDLLQSEFNELSEELDERLSKQEITDEDASRIKELKKKLAANKVLLDKLGALENKIPEYEKTVNDAQKRLDSLNKQEEEDRKKIVETLPEFQGLTYEEFTDKITELVEKNEAFAKQVKELYNYKPNLKEDLNPLLFDLGKIEARRRRFIQAIAKAYSENGVKDLEESIKKFDKDKKEAANKKEFDAKFNDKDLVRDNEDGVVYQVRQIGEGKELYAANDKGEYINKKREFKYTEGALERYTKIVKEETKNPVKPKEVVEVKEEELKLQVIPEDGKFPFDINPKPLPKDVLNKTTSHIGVWSWTDKILRLFGVKSNKRTELDNTIALQKFIQKTNFSEDKHYFVPISGEELFKEKWEAKQKELIKTGYHPESTVYTKIVNEKGEVVMDGEHIVYNTLSTRSAFKVSRGKNGSIKKISQIKKEDYISDDGIITPFLTKNKDGNFTFDKFKKLFAKEIAEGKVKKGDIFWKENYSDVFTDEVEVLEPKFATNRGNWKEDALKSEKRQKKFLENPASKIPITGKSGGIHMLEEEDYDVGEYLEVNGLTNEDVELTVATSTTIEIFDTSHPAIPGFTYLIDKKNGNLIRCVPRKLTEAEQQLVIDLLTAYCAKSEVGEKGKMSFGNDIEIEGTNTSLSILKTLNSIIGFGGINNVSQEAETKVKNKNRSVRKYINDLHKAIRKNKKELEATTDLVERNKLIKDINAKKKRLQELHNEFAVNKGSRAIYFIDEHYDYPPTQGGLIVIGTTDGKPNVYPLFAVDKDGKIVGEPKINFEVTSKLKPYLTDKYIQVSSQKLLPKHAKEKFQIPTKVTKGKIKVGDLRSYSEEQGGYKGFLLGNNPANEKGKIPTPIKTRAKKSMKEVPIYYEDGSTEYEGNKEEMPTHINRYLKYEHLEDDTKEKPDAKKTSKDAEDMGKKSDVSVFQEDTFDAPPTPEETSKFENPMDEFLDAEENTEDAEYEIIEDEGIPATQEKPEEQINTEYLFNPEALWKDYQSTIEELYPVKEDFIEYFDSLSEAQRSAMIEDIINNC